MKLSVIVPVYNEENTIKIVIEKVKKVKLKGILKEISRDDKTVNSVIALLSIFLILTATSLIIDNLMTIGFGFLSYLEVLKPGISLVLNLTEPIKWLLIGATGIIAIRTFRRS